MAQGKRTKIAVQMGAAIWGTAIATGLACGQSLPSHQQMYRGPATVSVATLKVPDQAWKHLEKARELATRSETSDSERECEKALAIAPEFPAARVMLASQELLLKKFAPAIANVTVARKAEPDAPWMGLILAAAYNGLRRYDDAIVAIQSLPAAEANTWQANYEKARAEIGLGQADAALHSSAEALEDAPKEFSETMLVRANALMLAHRWKDARVCLGDYLASPGPQSHRDQVRAVLLAVSQKAREDHEDPVSLASK